MQEGTVRPPSGFVSASVSRFECRTPDSVSDAAHGNSGRPDPELVMFVAGRPAAQGSKRHVGGGRLVEQSKAVGPWRTQVAWHAAQTYSGPPLDGPLVVEIEFVMPRPASCPKRTTPPAIKRPDLDKLTRAIFDALSGIWWHDDSQAVDLHARKRLARLDEQPGAYIHVSKGRPR